MSDTHSASTIVDKVLQQHPDMDLYIHAGDSEMQANWLKKRFHYFVRGNCDWLESFEEVITFEFANQKFLLIHGHLHLSYYSKNIIHSLEPYLIKNNANVVIFGHTHKKLFQISSGRTYLNPGSLLYPRDGSQFGSYAILTIENDEIKCNFFECKEKAKRRWF